MIHLIKSFQVILSTKDFRKLLFMSLALTLVACIEVGGLAAIGFLILNLETLETSLYGIQSINNLLVFFSIPKEYILYIFCGSIALYSLLTILISTTSIRQISIFGELAGSRIKTSVLKHFLSMNWLEFSKLQPSKKLSRVIHDGDAVADIITFFMHLLNKLILTAVICFALFLYNPLLTFLLALILAFAYIAMFLIFKSQTKKNSFEITQYMDTTVSMVTNIFGSFKEIILYNNQDKALSNFSKADSSLANLKGINTSIAHMPRFYIDSALLLVLALTSMIVSIYGISTTAYFATLSIYGIAALKILPAFQNIYYFAYEIFSRFPHLNNVTSLLEIKQENYAFDQSEAHSNFKKDISFKNISFAYEKSQHQSLSNLNINIQKGKKIAIIGSTGSGKSTFLDLLLGILEPSEGKITMDKIELSQGLLQDYRKNFSYVPQKIFFLEDTLENNIRFGSDEITDKKSLARSIDGSCLGDLIDSLPEGLDTHMSDYNQMVSGGQKQSIGIARALYRGGEILILDEATSGMDKKLENRTFDAIFDSKFSTFICVTHTLELLDKFDEIIIFKDGQIEAMGTYEDLRTHSAFLGSAINKQTSAS
jgi:ATP-binding cassette, subfamily B, bacterial PglK